MSKLYNVTNQHEATMEAIKKAKQERRPAQFVKDFTTISEDNKIQTIRVDAIYLAQNKAGEALFSYSLQYRDSEHPTFKDVTVEFLNAFDSTGEKAARDRRNSNRGLIPAWCVKCPSYWYKYMTPTDEIFDKLISICHGIQTKIKKFYELIPTAKNAIESIIDKNQKEELPPHTIGDIEKATGTSINRVDHCVVDCGFEKFAEDEQSQREATDLFLCNFHKPGLLFFACCSHYVNGDQTVVVDPSITF